MVKRNLLVESLMTLRLLSFSLFLIHLFPCVCGSMISGHLLSGYVVMMPLSIDRSSAGRPWMFHARILSESPRIFCSDQSGEN